MPGPVTDTLGAAARDAGAYLVIGVQEREPHGATIYNTTLYFGPDGALLGKHRKLMPTGSERTVWGMGDGSTLPVIDTPHGRLSGLTCWENYMPLARFYLYSQGVDIWAAPTLARGDGWIATMRHIALRGPLLRHRGQPVPARRPDPGRLPAPGPGLARRAGRRRAGWSPATASSSTPTASSWPGRPGTRRPSSTPTSTSPPSAPPAGSSTRSATTTGRTSSSSVDTRPRPPVVLRGAPAEESEPASARPSGTAQHQRREAQHVAVPAQPLVAVLPGER